MKCGQPKRPRPEQPDRRDGVPPPSMNCGRRSGRGPVQPNVPAFL